MRAVQARDVKDIGAPAYRDYVRHFVDARADLRRVMEGFGVPLGKDEGARTRCARLASRLERLGARVRNDGKSLVYGPLSPACARCRTGEKSVSEFISLACNRSCYFCFNENQCDYDVYKNARKDWRGALDSFSRRMDGLDFVALTGGEPMLFKDEALAFFRSARAQNPGAHLRLYTSGESVDARTLSDLARVGLDEIRFSVKLDEPKARQEEVLSTLEAAVGVISSVMVEMPVIPGTHDQMNTLLARLDAAGAVGVNLLEFCFPLHNADAYRKRGFRLVSDPYRIAYDYGYAGAIPVEGSEELALRLMVEQIERGTRLGLHYCSLENKNTAQIFEQNQGGDLVVPGYAFSRRSFFYECVRAFGRDAQEVARLLEEAGAPQAFDAEGMMAAFVPEHLALIPEDAGLRLFMASAVIERDSRGKRSFREVGLEVLEPGDAARLAHDADVRIEEP